MFDLYVLVGVAAFLALLFLALAVATRGTADTLALTLALFKNATKPARRPKAG